jgi:hypothetical protein
MTAPAIMKAPYPQLLPPERDSPLASGQGPSCHQENARIRAGLVPHRESTSDQAPFSMALIIALAISSVPTAVGSSRCGFIS